MEPQIKEKTSRLWVLWLVLLVPSLFLAVSALFMFDAPGSAKSVLTRLLASSLMLLPLTLFVGAINGFVYRKALTETGGWIVYLPLINLLVFVASFFLLIVLCGGSFRCWL